MPRYLFLLIGTFGAFAAWVLISDQKQARRPVAAKQAAELLQQAWADHRTRA